jgi:hypothetical protein
MGRPKFVTNSTTFVRTFSHLINVLKKLSKSLERITSLSTTMFSLFWDQPVYRTYYAYDPWELRRRQQRSRYLNDLQNQLASLLNDESDEFWDVPTRPRQATQRDGPEKLESQPSHPQQQQEQQQPPADSPRTNEQQQPETPRHPPAVYRYQSSARYNGSEYVEEHRERYVAEDRSVHFRSRRRLGDKWHETEDHTDAEGKTTQREIWHNVPDDQIESFKQEWGDRHQPKPAIEQQTTAGQSPSGDAHDAKHD